MIGVHIALFLVFFVVPLIVGISAPWWFWRLTPFKRLKATSAGETVLPPVSCNGDTTTVAAFCDMQEAKKVVVVAHLKPAAEQFVDTFHERFGILGMTSLTLLVFVVLLKATDASSVAELARRVSENFFAIGFTSLPNVAVGLVSIGALRALYKQVRDYRGHL